MENQSVKMFSLPRDVIALSGVSSKNTSRTALNAVHFDGKNAMASDGHRLALVPFDNPELAGVSLNLGEVKKPKSAYIVFTKTGETRFLSEVGPADVVDCAPPDYNAVIPFVSPDTHWALALNVELLIGLYKAIDDETKGDKKGFLTLLISKRDNLDAIGVVSSNSAGIGVLMPCRPFGGAGFPGAFEKYNAISGKAVPVAGETAPVEGDEAAPVAEEIAQVEEAAPLSSDVAAVFKQPGEVADTFKTPVVEEAEEVDPYSWEAEMMEEEGEAALVEEDEAEQGAEDEDEAEMMEEETILVAEQMEEEEEAAQEPAPTLRVKREEATALVA